jgi:lysine 2,3-aminomutase
MMEKRVDDGRTLTTTTELAAAGLIDAAGIEPLKQVAERYPVAITRAIVQLIDASDPEDPIARQFLPSEAELNSRPGENSDPIGDERHSPVKGIVHRHRNRVLLKLTLVCPVYCRFCFRRAMVGPGAGQMLTRPELDAAIAWISRMREVREVILTGGDPLMLSARRIADVTRRLASIDHVDVLRWHSRVPIADPERVTDAMVRAIRSAKAAWLVLHVNHPRELSAAALSAVAKFIDAGVPVLSQSVLLKGINDSVAVLQALMHALIAARVKPYYVHHMDLAPGTEHFRTSVADGRALVTALRHAVSGLAYPHYVLDIPGGYAKAQLAESELELKHGSVRLRDGDGAWHDYLDS